MKAQSKASVLSFAIHALIFAAVIMISRSIPGNKPIVIDFSLAGSNGSVGSIHRTSPVDQKAAEKNKKSAARSHKPKTSEAESKPPPPSLTDHSEASVSETGPPPPADSIQDSKSQKTSPGGPEGASGGLSENNSSAPAAVSGNDAFASAEGVRAAYLRQHFTYIRDTIMKKITYPSVARKMGWSGRVTIAFVICENGDAEDIRITESSGFDILDRNAVETVKKALPLPRPPLRAEIVIPVIYRLN